MRIDGGCHCGFIKYEGEADPEKTRDLPLHRLPDASGSAFRTVGAGRSDSFRMTRASPRSTSRPAKAGTSASRRSARKCGSPIFSADRIDGPKVYMIRAGTIRQRDQFVPKVQYWTRSRQRWVHDFALVTRSWRQQQ